MGFDNGQIILDSPNNTYYAGQTINGRLKFSRDKVKKFRGIYVHLRGYCKVHWTTRERNMHSRSDHDRYRTIDHDSYEDYFDQRIYLIGSKSGDHQLQPGDHDMPFSFRIPDNCPSPIEGEYGHVRYSLKVVVDRAFKVDQELTAPIKIISPLDLNMVPIAQEPIQMKIEETYCCWCFNAGSSETVVRLPTTGYCVGQVMPVEVNCINRSTDEIDIKIAIKRELTYHAHSAPGTRHSRGTILEDKRGPVPPHVTRAFTIDVVVPEHDVLNMRNCSYIDVEYELKITVSPDGCHNDSDDSCTLIFGTIALGATSPMQFQQPAAPLQAYPQAVTQQPYPGLNSPYQPNQAYPSPPYPGGIPSNTPYPTPNPSYPTGYPYPPGPQINSPYSPGPQVNSPYPSGPPANSPYPQTNSPYPAGPPTHSPCPAGPQTNSPYPPGPQTNSPYPPGPQTNSPYPPGPQTNSPYPPGPQHNSPYPAGPQTNSPYPAGPQTASPYPIGPHASPYPPAPQTMGMQNSPNTEQSSPYANQPATNPQFGTPGRISPYPPGAHASFNSPAGNPDDKGGVSIPLLPPGNVPMPKSASPATPYAASAPEPSTPDEKKPLMPDGNDESQPPPYNPAFANQKAN